MRSSLTQQIIKLETLTQVERALEERRMQILEAIEAGTVKSSPELMSELCELNIALGDVPEVGDEN